MLIQLHPENPEKRTLKKISEDLKDGAVYVFPTDTVYSFVADSQSKSGIERLYKLKDLEKSKPLSLLCSDISIASEFIEYLPNPAFRLMKRITPGPFTFIFKANKKIPRVSLTNQKTKNIGIRIPNQIFLRTLFEVHGSTLTGTSVYSLDKYFSDVGEVETMYAKKVDGIVDGGILTQELSTILDFSSGEMEILRVGKGFEQIEDS